MQNCLVVDDEDQGVFIDELRDAAKVKGLEVNFIPFNPREGQWLNFEDSAHPNADEALLKEALKNVIDNRVDLVLCDYDFKIKNIDGFDILRWIRSIHKKTELVLYSGKGDFQQDYAATFKREPQAVKSIILCKISDIIDRADRKGVMLNLLAKTRYSTDLFIEEELNKYPTLKFKDSYPHFEGQTIESILHYITDGSAKGFLFKKSIIELTIAHLIDIND